MFAGLFKVWFALPRPDCFVCIGSLDVRSVFEAVLLWLTGLGGGVLASRCGIEVWDPAEAAGMVDLGRRVCDWVAEKEVSWAGLVGDSKRGDSL